MAERIKKRIKDSRIPKDVNYPSFAYYMKAQFLTSLPHLMYMAFSLVVFGAIVGLLFADFRMLICLYLIVIIISFLYSAFMENLVVSIYAGLIFGVISGIWCYVVDFSYVHLHFLQVMEICIIMSALMAVFGFFLWPIIIEGIEE